MSKNKKASLVGSKYLKEIKESLNMQSRDALAWEKMRINDRSLLVRSAQLSNENVRFEWSRINPESQQKIRAAAKRAAAWVNQLELI